MIRSIQLVFDCADPDRIIRFWGPALQYPDDFAYGGAGWGATDDEVRSFRVQHPQYDGRGRIDDDDRRRVAIFIQRVPEPKQQLNRVRPELAVPENHLQQHRQQLAALGATIAELGPYRDLEGNEFTLVGDQPRPGVEVWMQSIVIDCLDPARMVAFWSAALGYSPAGDRCDPVDPMPSLSPGLSFHPVAEPKTVKNRLHLDLNFADYEAETDRLCDLGATVVARHDSFIAFQDPEGNEFCTQ